MIYIFDFLCQGRSHLQFNSAFLQVVAKAFPSRAVFFFADRSHIESLIEEVGPFPNTVSLSFLPESAARVDGGGGRPIRDIGAIEYLRRVALPQNTVILGANAWFLEELRCNRSLHRQSNFDIVFHSSLSAPACWRTKHPLNRRRDLFGILGRRFAPQIRLIVLEHAIESNIRKLVRSSTKTAVVEYPAADQQGVEDALPQTERLQIGFIGNTTQAKGFDIFCEGASRGNAAVDFHCISTASSEYDGRFDPLFSTPPQRQRLSQIELELRLRRMELICLPLDPVFYSWTASGTLNDCFRFGIPPVTMKSDVTKDIEQRYGQFGYLLENRAEMIQFLETIDRKQFSTCRDNMRTILEQIRQDRAVSALASSFRLNDGL